MPSPVKAVAYYMSRITACAGIRMDWQPNSGAHLASPHSEGIIWTTNPAGSPKNDPVRVSA
jgi:hypothetical protein